MPSRSRPQPFAFLARGTTVVFVLAVVVVAYTIATAGFRDPQIRVGGTPGAVIQKYLRDLANSVQSETYETLLSPDFREACSKSEFRKGTDWFWGENYRAAVRSTSLNGDQARVEVVVTWTQARLPVGQGERWRESYELRDDGDGYQLIGPAWPLLSCGAGADDLRPDRHRPLDTIVDLEIAVGVILLVGLPLLFLGLRSVRRRPRVPDDPLGTLQRLTLYAIALASELVALGSAHILLDTFAEAAQSGVEAFEHPGRWLAAPLGFALSTPVFVASWLKIRSVASNFPLEIESLEHRAYLSAIVAVCVGGVAVGSVNLLRMFLDIAPMDESPPVMVLVWGLPGALHVWLSRGRWQKVASGSPWRIHTVGAAVVFSSMLAVGFSVMLGDLVIATYDAVTSEPLAAQGMVFSEISRNGFAIGLVGLALWIPYWAQPMAGPLRRPLARSLAAGGLIMFIASAGILAYGAFAGTDDPGQRANLVTLAVASGWIILVSAFAIGFAARGGDGH